MSAVIETSPPQQVLRLENISHWYQIGQQKLHILQQANLQLTRGEITALIAPSGAGKTTIMYIAGLLLQPQEGQIYINNFNCRTAKSAQIDQIRSQCLGFVYQHHLLMGELSCLQNVMLPHLILGHSFRSARERAAQLLTDVGLLERARHLPSELSGGERQRCAIARALINNPDCILADEPTGNLDPKSANEVWQLFLQVLKQYHSAALVVTHNPILAGRVDTIMQLNAGKIQQAQRAAPQ